MRLVKRGVRARTSATVLCLVLVIALAACAGGSLLGNEDSGAPGEAGSATVTPAGTPSPSASDDAGSLATIERDIATQLVAQLTSQCTALSPELANPSNWAFTSTETGGLPFEMTITLVDDRTLFLFATPYPSGEVKITPYPESAATAYSIFSTMGCNPVPGSPKPKPSTDPGAATVTLPSFSGDIELDVDAWFARNARRVSVEYDYGTDSNPDCEDSGEGDVIGQSPAAGTVVANSSTTHVLVDIDCSW